MKRTKSSEKLRKVLIDSVVDVTSRGWVLEPGAWNMRARPDILPATCCAVGAIGVKIKCLDPSGDDWHEIDEEVCPSAVAPLLRNGQSVSDVTLDAMSDGFEYETRLWSETEDERYAYELGATLRKMCESETPLTRENLEGVLP